MRVLVLTPEFIPVYGGVGNYVVQIAKNMPSDMDIHIVCPHHVSMDSENADDEREMKSLPSNVLVTHLGRATDTFFHNFSFQLNCARFVPEVVRKEGIDIVHSQSSMPDYFVSPKKLSVPSVTTMHTTVEGHYLALKGADDLDDLSTSERFVLTFGPMLGAMERRYYTNRRHYITVSDWAKRMMTSTQGIHGDRIKVIRIGVDPETFNPSRRRDGSLAYPELADLDDPKILYLSRLAARKGIHTFLKAASIALTKVDAHFVVAGSGKKPGFELPPKNYTYLGYVPRGAPPYLYAMSDVFVLPSSYENFPACILEAMASGSAVVSTTVGGIPEMIRDGENGILLKPNDSEGLAKALIQLVENDSLRREMISKAMKYAVGSYSWRNAALQTKHYYEEIT